MKWNRTRLRSLVCTGSIVAILALATPAFAQGCSLCYTQAAASGQKMIQALRSGILILVLPPTLGSVGMLFIVHRKKNQVRRSDDPDNSAQQW